MLRGESVHLRPVRQGDLQELYTRHIDLAGRGPFFPLGMISESEFRRHFDEHGFWRSDEGMMLTIAGNGSIVGHVEFFKTVDYLDELELSYHIYEREQRGQGYATEAVRLLVRYLFARLKVNRIRLIIHPQNEASCRVAQKCGFVREGTARGAWYHRGQNHDVHVYALLRDEVDCVQ